MAWIGLTLGPDTPYEDLIATINEIITRLDDENITKVYRDSNGDDRYIEGQLPDGLGVKVSKEGVKVGSADDNQLIYKDDFSTRTWYDDNNDRILLGKLPDGTYGMVISKEGKNATDLF